MTPWHLKDLMGKHYLNWHDDVYTSSDRLMPVLKLLFLQVQTGAQQIKLEYYKNLGCSPDTLVSSEYLDAKLSDEELLRVIDAHMRTDRWFEMPECFTGEQCYSLSLPAGFMKIEAWADGLRRSFTVESAGYGASYRDSEGHRVSTATVFDLCMPTDTLDIGIWYLFSFTCVREEKTTWRGFDKYDGNKESLVLTATLRSWCFGISAYIGAYNAQVQTQDFYEIRYAPDKSGFLLLVKQKGMDRIWLKAAWLKSEGLDANLCQQALRHWLE